MALVMEQMRQSSRGQFVGQENQSSGRRNGVTLEEKYFRRVTAFEGDFAKFRGWLFDLNVAIGQVDKELAGELERLVKTTEQDKWRPEEDRFLRRDLYSKYKSELYGGTQEHSKEHSGPLFRAGWIQSHPCIEPQI